MALMNFIVYKVDAVGSLSERHFLLRIVRLKRWSCEVVWCSYDAAPKNTP